MLVSPEGVSRELRSLVEGEVLGSDLERSMYASDASSYEIMPLCVVLPKSKVDVVRTVRFAFERRIPIIARGGGSGLAGQAVGSGIILDFSRHMNRVLEVNPRENYIVVEPGVYKGQVDAVLRRLGKVLPPDPSSADYCTIGGMIANNGCGPHTVKYGAMVDYVLSLEAVLHNGEVIRTRPVRLDSDEWGELVARESLEAQIYREVRRLVEDNGQLIASRFPKVKKNASGYRLEKVIQGGVFDLGKLLVSSEGTLAVVVEATLRIVDAPKKKGLAMLFFDSIGKAGRAVGEILKLQPSALEMLDYTIVELARAAYPEVAEKVPPGVRVILLAEFDGETADEVEECMERLRREALGGDSPDSRALFAFTPEEMAKLWEVRKKALPLAYKHRKGDKRPIAFIEDVVVNPHALGDFLEELHALYGRHGVEGVVYGHAGDGHVHTRPLLNLKERAELEKMARLAEEVFRLAIKYGGSITGEHGDGLARTEYVKALYGEEVYELFRRVKRVFDPYHILNPGKKVSEEEGLMVKNLRHGPGYKRREISTALNWGLKDVKLVKQITGYDQELDYGGEVELCHGCGYCRELSYTGRMCPVYKGLGGEVDSCRGRNNLLRWLLKLGGLAQSVELTDEYGEAIYKHCIQCMMCYVDCPSNVNVGKLMAEARARYAAARGLPKGYKLFLDLDRYGRLGCRAPALANWLLRNRAFRAAMERLTGIDRRRNFPPFAAKTFTQMFSEYRPRLEAMDLPHEAVFFYDTYINFNNPRLGMAIVKVLERNGYRTVVPPQKSSGLPAIVEGAPRVARRIAEFNVRQLAPYAARGIPIVCFSPSAGITLKLQYLNVLDTREARLVADQTYDIHEFLYQLYREGALNTKLAQVEKNIYVHLHCHTIVQRVEREVLSLLRLIPGLNPTVLEKGCCGVGGSYSFIKGNYELSIAMGRELFDAVKGADREVYSTGESCSLQIEAGSGRRVGLTVDLLGVAYGVG